jgi:hypothetical protein
VASFFERPLTLTTFPIISAVLRLSTKYDVDYLRRRACLHISAAAPGSLADYDAMLFTREQDVVPPHFPFLLLVHGLGLTWALPVAFYGAACCPVELIIDGFSVEGTHFVLPPALQRTCLIARAILSTSQHQDIYGFMRSGPTDGCLTQAANGCQIGRLAALEAASKISAVEPFAFAHPIVWDRIRPVMCHVCQLAAETKQQAPRQKVWDSLPSIFGLPSWDELNVARVADLK